MRSVLSLTFAVLVLGVASCGSDGYRELGLVEVTGTVTLDGKPLSGAKVCFESEDKRLAVGTTDASGKYVLMYDSQTPGALPGIKTVRITTADAEVEGGGAGEGAVLAKETVPAKYNEKSELKADVSPSNRVFNFDLKTS